MHENVHVHQLFLDENVTLLIKPISPKVSLGWAHHICGPRQIKPSGRWIWLLRAQVVRGLDAFHFVMGSLLLLLHTSGVRILQRSAGESVHARQRRSASLSHRYHRPLLRGLPWLPFPSHCLRSPPHRSPVPQISLRRRSPWLPPLGCHLQGMYVFHSIFNFFY